MATIGWIKVGLSADTAKFAKDLEKASKQIKDFASGTEALIAGAVGAVATGAFSVWIKGAMDASDAVHDMAREVGVGNEELQKLHHAGKVAGVDAESMDHSLGKLNQTLGKIAQDGTGPAADALRRFGTSARELASKGPAEAFRASVDILSRIPNAAERATVAVELFGKAGQTMIRLAGEGAGAVDKLGEEAKALGLAISDVDSEKIGEANDALDRVWGVVQGLANSIAVQLSPYLTYVADLFVDWAKEGSRTSSIISQGFDFVKTAIGYAADAWQVLSTGFHYFQAIFAEGISYILGALGKLADALIYVIRLIPGVTVEGKNGFTELAKDFEKAAIGELGKAEMTWNRKWAHEGVREFVDGIKIAAQQRAGLAAGKEAEFRKGGAFNAAKPAELKFGGALELGSKEAYSASLQSRGMRENSVQQRIATDAKTTADATSRTALAIEQVRDFVRQNAGGGAVPIPGGI